MMLLMKSENMQIRNTKVTIFYYFKSWTKTRIKGFS